MRFTDQQEELEKILSERDIYFLKKRSGWSNERSKKQLYNIICEVGVRYRLLDGLSLKTLIESANRIIRINV